MNPTKIIIHHSLTQDGQTVSWGAIRKYHVEIMNWKNIGYHYGIELVGDTYEIFKGRMDNENGAHCLGYNENSIGICLVGNFDSVEPCNAQVGALQRLCRSLMEIYGIKALDVLGHWETYAMRGVPVGKTCPGIRFNMDNFRKML